MPSINLVEEVNEFLKIYFVVWFRARNLYHSYQKQTNWKLASAAGWLIKPNEFEE